MREDKGQGEDGEGEERVCMRLRAPSTRCGSRATVWCQVLVLANKMDLENFQHGNTVGEVRRVREK